MVASSTYELALKCPECVNLHTDFHRDLFWNRPYLMCTSTICLDGSKLHLLFPVKDIDRAARQITEDLKKAASLVLAE